RISLARRASSVNAGRRKADTSMITRRFRLPALLPGAALGLSALASCDRPPPPVTREVIPQETATTASASASASSSASALAPQPGDAPRASTAPAPSDTPDAAVKACDQRTGATRLLWRDASFDLVLATEVFPCLSDAERAAVGYVATTIGSQCDWES